MKVFEEKDVQVKVIPEKNLQYRGGFYIVNHKLNLSTLTLELYINSDEQNILSKREIKKTIKLCKQIVARTLNEYQEFLEPEVTHSEKIRLRKYINKIVREYCNELNLKLPVIIIEDIPFGNLGFTIAEKNKIHLNSYLGRVPYRYADLVLYHELLHLKYPKKKSENSHSQKLIRRIHEKFENYLEIGMEAVVIEAILAKLFFPRLVKKYSNLLKQ